MGSNFLRSFSKWSRLRVNETRLFIAHVGIFTAEAQCVSKQQQWRAYARFPTQLSKTRGPNTSSSPSSSSSSHSSYTKAAFVGWYLGKLESWPLITKCISSSLIYTAADLTSQGQLRLRHDVRACEYEDVHVMWEMLKSNKTKPSAERSKKRFFFNFFDWARCTPYLCRSF